MPTPASVWDGGKGLPPYRPSSHPRVGRHPYADARSVWDGGKGLPPYRLASQPRVGRHPYADARFGLGRRQGFAALN
jgi:hypothetical protein